MDNLATASMEKLTSVNGVGPNIALAIKDWFDRPANKELLEKFRKIGIWPEQTQKLLNTQGSLADKTFVISGTLPTLSRENAKRLIEENGGKTTDSVSKNTSYLLLGDNPGSKLDKAKALGIPIIEEAELLAMVNARS